MILSRRSTRISLVLAGACLLAGLAAPASAQVFFRPFYHGGYYEGPVYAPVPRRNTGIGALAVLEELQDRGYRAVTIVGRRPDVFVVDAIDARRQRVRLIVDAYDGEILERFGREREAGPREPGPRDASPLAIEPRRREQARPPKVENSEGRVAEVPVPPRRPNGGAIAPAPAPLAGRPAPVAPARDPSTWAPINSVPVAPLE
jgi:hypothetical protein